MAGALAGQSVAVSHRGRAFRLNPIPVKQSASTGGYTNDQVRTARGRRAGVRRYLAGLCQKLESKLGRGTSVHLYLPVAQRTEAPQAVEVRHEAAHASGGHERILRRIVGPEKVRLLMSWVPDVKSTDVPDPYYGGPAEFEHALDLIERACDGLLAELRQRKVEAIRSVRPDLVATGNIGCITQIAAGMDIPIAHTVELLDWAYGGPIPRGLEALSRHVKNVPEPKPQFAVT